MPLIALDRGYLCGVQNRKPLGHCICHTWQGSTAASNYHRGINIIILRNLVIYRTRPCIQQQQAINMPLKTKYNGGVDEVDKVLAKQGGRIERKPESCRGRHGPREKCTDLDVIVCLYV